MKRSRIGWIVMVALCASMASTDGAAAERLGGCDELIFDDPRLTCTEIIVPCEEPDRVRACAANFDNFVDNDGNILLTPLADVPIEGPCGVEVLPRLELLSFDGEHYVRLAHISSRCILEEPTVTENPLLRLNEFDPVRGRLFVVSGSQCRSTDADAEEQFCSQGEPREILTLLAIDGFSTLGDVLGLEPDGDDDDDDDSHVRGVAPVFRDN